MGNSQWKDQVSGPKATSDQLRVGLHALLLACWCDTVWCPQCYSWSILSQNERCELESQSRVTGNGDEGVRESVKLSDVTRKQVGEKSECEAFTRHSFYNKENN